jgi:hypothetical protein
MRPNRLVLGWRDSQTGSGPTRKPPRQPAVAAVRRRGLCADAVAEPPVPTRQLGLGLCGCVRPSDGQAGAPAGTLHSRAIYNFHPKFAAARSPFVLYSATTTCRTTRPPACRSRRTSARPSASNGHRERTWGDNLDATCEETASKSSRSSGRSLGAGRATSGHTRSPRTSHRTDCRSRRTITYGSPCRRRSNSMVRRRQQLPRGGTRSDLRIRAEYDDQPRHMGSCLEERH